MAFGDIKGTKSGSATSITASFAISTGTNFAVVVGDLIVTLLAEQAANTVTACTDNLTNTYTALGAGADAGTVAGRGFYTRVTNAGTISSVTFTATASSNNCVGLAVGFEGPFAVSPLDANPTTIINDNTTPYICPSTGTLAQNDEKIVCAIVHNGAPTFTATAPNLKAIELATASILKAALGHQTVSSTASVTPAWTSSATPTASGYATVSFKKAPTISSGDGTAGGVGTATAQSGVATIAGAGTAAGVGTATAPGFATTADAWSSADKSAAITLSNSDKTAILSSSVTAGVRSTQRRTSGAVGKFYVELVINAANPFNVQVGFSSTAQSVSATTDAIRVSADDGTVFFGASTISDAWAETSVNGDVICLAWDTSAKGVWVRLNSGNWNDSASADPATGYGGALASSPDAVDYALWMRAANSGRGATLRTEAAEFTYSGPSGFTSWMGEALAAATTDGVGNAAGVGAAAAVSGATKETAGTAAGIATATGASPSATTDAAGAASGIGTASAVGVAFTGIPDAWSAADKSANITLSNNDKTATLSSAVTGGVRSTTKYLNGTEANKFYVEFVLTNAISGFSCQVGIREASAAVNTSAGSTFQCASNSGNIVVGSSTTVGNIGGAPLLDGDVICMAWSPSTERGWFRKNGGLWNNDAAANPATNTNGFDISALNNTSHGLLFLAASSLNGAIVTVRTEAADLTLTAPSGFVSWMGEALGAATTDGVGDADGVGTAAATGDVGSAAVSATGTAAGVGTATATGFSHSAAAVGTAIGIGSATGLSSGAAIASATGNAPGVGAANGVGAKRAEATASAAGVGAATATAGKLATTQGAASALGVASASSSAAAFVSGVGAATGIGAAAATGGKIATAQGAAAGLGIASGSSSAAAYVSGVGAASGIGAAAATGFATSAAAVGTAAGVGAAAATGQKIASTTGAVVGVGGAAAATGATKTAAGAASGIGSATAAGFQAAVVFEEAAGSANGVGTTSGIGFAILPSATPGDRVTELPFAPRSGSLPASMRGVAVAGSRRIAAVAGHNRIAIVPRRDRAA